MAYRIKRRTFLERSVLATAGAGLAFGFEERALLAYAEGQPATPKPDAPPSALPTGKIGDVVISRLICGGNLISGFAHSRDLIYVSELLKKYFTDEKVFETFRLAEENGINTAILRLDPDTLRIINKYWRDVGGNLQWIAQIKPRQLDLTSDVRKAIDNGAIGVYIQGEAGDAYVKNGHVDLLAKTIACIKDNGVIAGMGAHSLEVVMTCEREKIPSDFYMKTFNSKSYWSAGPAERHDSVWEETPKETAEFMQKLDKPWIAFKVLGAGAIRPEEGFPYAFEHGADFICAGMFDFQIKDDAVIAAKAVSAHASRERPWRA